MPTLLHRFERVSASASTRRRTHVRGEVRSPVTDAFPKMQSPAGETLTVESLAPTLPDDELANIMARRKQDLARRRGPKPKPHAEFLFVGAKRIGEGWSVDKAREWGQACLAWCELRMPDSWITDAALHLDETQWHVHVTTIPAAVEDGKLQWGMSAVRRAMDAELSGRKRASMSRAVVGAAVSRMQDDVFAHVGEPFGLERGVKGSKRRHVAVSEAEAAKARMKEVSLVERRAARIMKKAKAREAELAERAVVFEHRLASLNRRIGEFNATVEARAAKLKEREEELEARHERAAEIAAKLEAELAQLAERKRRLDEHERAHGKLAAQRRDVKAKNEAVERGKREGERLARANKETLDRIELAMKCMDQALGTLHMDDAGEWQNRAHLVIHGDEQERASVAALFAKPAKSAPEREKGQAVEVPKGGLTR